jgi:hypothetical protein
MTRTRFGFAVIFQSFGLLRKTKRMTDAAFEAHLMQDGEELLGKYCWKNIENIEDLSMEYWNIRRLEREQKEIQEKIDAAEQILGNAHERRAEAADRSKEMGQGLTNGASNFSRPLITLRSSGMTSKQRPNTSNASTRLLE